MRRFLIKIALFFLLFFVLEKGFLYFLYRAPALEYDQRLEMVLKGEMNKDIIVIGSSRGAEGVLASKIEDSTRLSTYNLSYVGSDVLFHEFIVRTLFKFNRPPKAILIVLDDPVELWYHDRSNFRWDRLYPLAIYNHVNDELIARNGKSWISRFFALARIHDSNFFSPDPTIGPFDTLRSHGSLPLSFYYHHKMEAQPYAWKYDPTKEMFQKQVALKKIAAMCKRQRVQLIAVYPPNYKVHNPDFEQRMRDMLGDGVLHYRYNLENPAYKDIWRYHDADHLHISGARIFTDELIGYVERLGFGTP